MTKAGWSSSVSFCLAFLLILSVAIAAQSTDRVFVASNGDDSKSCSATAPCRTLTRALQVVSAGGEIVALDSAGYGQAIITKSVSIFGPIGIQAGVTVASGDGLTVNANASDVVLLRGIQFNGTGGANGLVINSAGTVYVETCQFTGFNQNGLRFLAAGRLFVTDTDIRKSSAAGLYAVPSGASTIEVSGGSFSNNGSGIEVNGRTTISVAGVSASSNTLAGFFVNNTTSSPAVMTAAEVTAVDNGYGLLAQRSSTGAARIGFADSTITGNGVGVSNGAAPYADTGEVTSAKPGSSLVARNGTDFQVGPGCVSLALGGASVLDMPSGADFCLASGAEYTIIPVNLASAASVSLTVTASGIVPVTGDPNPVIALSSSQVFPGTVPDDAFDHQLRLRERQELTPLIRRSDMQRPLLAIVPGVPTVGQVMDLNVQAASACGSPDIRRGEVKAVGTHIIIVEECTASGSGCSGPAIANGLTNTDYATIASTFDTLVWPTITGNFGTPTDIDGNGRVIAFYTKAVNELTPSGSSSYVGGFFFSRDLLPVTSCATSNLGEMFYMLMADPAGAVNGNVRSTAFIKQKTVGTIAHELQHMINASRRFYINSWNGWEEVWMEEGLSHIGEELVFYAAAGLTPGSNIGLAQIADGGTRQNAFFQYSESNFGRLRLWLLGPTSGGPFQSDDDLATRGAIWAFLRYGADRNGGTQSTFWQRLVDGEINGEAPVSGLANLQRALGQDPLPWFRDFAAAMYGDDAGIGVGATYSQPSWNFRSIYSGLNYGGQIGYPLARLTLDNTVPRVLTLTNGGAAAYLPVGVTGGAPATVSVRSNGATPPSTVRLIILRRE